MKLDLLQRGADGVSACNVQVAEWDELPPLEAPEEDLLVAGEHSGCCWRCHVDVQKERGRHGVDAESVVVAKFGGRNHTDPVRISPQDEVVALFQATSLTESTFVALGHMQVSFVTAQKTRLTKSRKNVISFSQDTPAFAQRVGLMCRYEVGDRVNSRLGPGTALTTTEGRLQHLISASGAEKRVLAADETGALVWPAAVKEVSASGQLVL